MIEMSADACRSSCKVAVTIIHENQNVRAMLLSILSIRPPVVSYLDTDGHTEQFSYHRREM